MVLWFSSILEHDCIGHFSVDMIRHDDQSELEKEESIWAYGSRERIHNDRESKAAGDQGRQRRDHIFDCEHEAGRSN